MRFTRVVRGQRVNGAARIGMRAWPALIGFVVAGVAARPLPVKQAGVKHAQGAQEVSPADSGVVAVLDSMAVGWNQADLEMYLRGYTEDATSRGLDGFVKGRNAARQVMREGFWKTGRPLQQLHYEHLAVRPLGANYALATGEYVLSGGGAADRTGWFTTIWIRTAHSWRCMHDHS